MKSEKIKNNAERIINVTNSILNIYNQLIESKTNKNIEKYIEYIKNLSLALFVENNIYKEIIKTDTDNFDSLLGIVSYSINQKNYDESTKELMIDRIENYLDEIIYEDKYPVETDDPDEFYEENNTIIEFECANDHIEEYINELDKLSIKTKNKQLRDSAIEFKYNLIFGSKEQEKYYLKENKKKHKSHKEKLIGYGHDEHIVEEVYSEYLTDRSLDIINILLENSVDKERYIDDIINLTDLKACTNIMDFETLKNLYTNFHALYYDNNNNICFNKLPINNINSIDNLLSNQLSNKMVNMSKVKTKTNTNKENWY